MLSLAPDFWPWFWAILATGAALTIALSAMIATLSPPWTGWHHQPHTPAAPHRSAKAAARGHDRPSRPRPAAA